MIIGEFQCQMCHEWCWLQHFAFSFLVDGEEQGVCGHCAELLP